jgi:hypothetical protein
MLFSIKCPIELRPDDIIIKVKEDQEWTLLS